MQAFPWIATAVVVALVFTALAARAALPPRAGRGANEDADVRLPVTALMLAALVASLAPMIVARRRVRSRVLEDERDQEVLARALAQPVGILLGYRRR